MGIVEGTKLSGDGCVRSVTIQYSIVQRNPGGEDKVTVVRVNRSIQRLILIMPVEEQTTPLMVKSFDFYVQCTVQLWKRGCKDRIGCSQCSAHVIVDINIIICITLFYYFIYF